MSADLLRRAAAKLREHAEACEAGPWIAVGTDGHGHELGHAWLNLPAYQHAWSMHGFTAEARYVAMMHPPVALALSDVFERLAYLDRGAVNAIDNDLMADIEHLAGQVFREDGES